MAVVERTSNVLQLLWRGYKRLHLKWVSAAPGSTKKPMQAASPRLYLQAALFRTQMERGEKNQCWLSPSLQIQLYVWHRKLTKNCNLETNSTLGSYTDSWKANWVFVLSQTVSSHPWTRIQNISKWRFPWTLPGSPHFPAPLCPQDDRDHLVKMTLLRHPHPALWGQHGQKQGESCKLQKWEANTQHQHPLPFSEATSHLHCSLSITLHAPAPKSRPAPDEISAIGLPGMWQNEEEEREEEKVEEERSKRWGDFQGRSFCFPGLLQGNALVRFSRT